MNTLQETEKTYISHQWIVLSIALLTLGGFIFYNQFHDYQRIATRERDSLTIQAQTVEKNVAPQLLLTNHVIEDILKDLPSWQAENDGLKHGNHELKTIYGATTGIGPILVLQADGKVIASSNEKLVGMNFAHREYFKTALRKPDPKVLYVSAPFKTVLDTYVINLFRTIPGPNGKFAGIVIVSLVPEYFSILLDSVRYAPDMRTAIIHGDGKVFLMSPNKAGATSMELAKPGPLFTRHLESGKTANVFKGTALAIGGDCLTAMRTIQLTTPPMDKPLVVSVDRELEAIYAPWRKRAYVQGILFGMITISCTLGLLITQRRRRDQINERRLAFEALKASEENHRAILRTAMDGVWLVDTMGRLIEANETYSHMSGYSEQELLTMSISDLEVSETAEETATHIRKIIERGEDRFTSKHRRKDGTVYNVEVSFQCRQSTDGGQFVAFLRDISERTKAEEESHKYSQLLKKTGEMAHIGGWELDLTKKNLFWSEQVYQIHEVKPYTIVTVEEAIGFYLPEDRAVIHEAVESLTESGKPFDHELQIITAMNNRRWVRTQGEAEYCEGKVVKIFGTFQDITERKQQENAIRKSEYEFRMLAEAMPQIVWVCSPDGKYIYFNQQWVEYTGLTLEESYGDGWNRPFHPEDQQMAWEAWQNVIKNGATYDLECRLRRADGVYKWWLIRGVPVHDEHGDVLKWFGTCTDIDELRKAEEEKRVLEQQFQQAQKLESLGVLSGGIAHDFNNILTVIMGNCALAKRCSDNTEKYILEIEKASERAAELCRQMLAYAGKAQLTPTQVNIWVLVNEMVNMLKSTLPQNAVIKTNLTADIPLIHGDASQIRQIVMNLVINASEAIGEAQGEIRVSLTTTTIIAGQADKDHQGKAIPPGAYACLEISDNGCGMDEETRRRIFEPFYTTKFKGRGLGMSAVLGIVAAHNGALQLFSLPGQGTIFKVYLPLQHSDSAGDDSLNQTTPSAPWQGTGTILLVEDEDKIRLIAKTLLEIFGFTVIEATNGKEALELYQKNAADITVVVTDMGMPVMDGYALFRELKKRNSQLPIMISSGFGDADITSRIARDEIAGIISKPYNPDRLLELLKSIC